MGFNPADVKWMILSHGHVDHFGAANFLRECLKGRYIGEPDAKKMFQENPELALIQEIGPVDINQRYSDLLKY